MRGALRPPETQPSTLLPVTPLSSCCYLLSPKDPWLLGSQ